MCRGPTQRVYPVELLVVITTIGVLIGCCSLRCRLPARRHDRSQCQTTSAVGERRLNHESLWKRFPTDGWGVRGPATRTREPPEPAGRMDLQHLPFIEQPAMHSTWRGTRVERPDQDGGQPAANVGGAADGLYCPTRRKAIACA